MKEVDGRSGELEVCDECLRTPNDINLSINARQPPLVLVLQIGSIAPATHPNCQSVLPPERIVTITMARACTGAVSQGVGDLELRREARVLAVADSQAVQPHRAAGVNPFEHQEVASLVDVAVSPGIRKGKLSTE